MRKDKRFTILSAIVLLTLLYSLLIPTGALADDATPPADTTSDTVEAGSTPPPPVVVATEETEEPTREPALDEALPTAEASSVETAPEETDGETITEIVTAAAEQDVTLADENGEPLELGSVEAAELLTNGDPFFWNGSSWVGYSTANDCPASVTCNVVASPFQAAVSAAPAGTTIYVAGDDSDATPTSYLEAVTINTANLSFIGYDQSLAVTLVANNDPTAPTYTAGYANVTSITLNALFGNTTGVTATTVFVNDAGTIQDGVDLVAAGGTVDVAPGDYPENVVIQGSVSNLNSKDGITIIGEPGAGGAFDTVAGSAWNAPEMDGTGTGGNCSLTTLEDCTGPGETPRAAFYLRSEGVTITGFYIHDYQTAIYENVISGSNTNSIWNNTITDNVNGLVVSGGIGTPGTELHYNIFSGNTGFDVMNSPYDSNIQFLHAQNNYWGCPDGPVVARKVYTGNPPTWDGSSYLYYLWATSTGGGNQDANMDQINWPTEYGDCALLYGRETGGNPLWYNNKGQGGTYDPYKIVIGAVNPPTETCPDGYTGTYPNCTAPSCGDGVVNQTSEQCDDGNTNNNDSCTNACTSARCGDGIVNGNDQCDDGNQVNTDGCTNACTTPRCGDGIVNGTDQCDDGNLVNNDACTNACTTPTCGDGIVNGTDQCDDGNQVNNDACTNACTTPRCGDGIVNGTDQCDDGNTNNTDGCSNACTVSTCGDGIIQPPEQCDDANQTNTDSCTNTCTTPRCGDGIVNGTDQCDDGNAVNTDSCTNACTTPRCGDGIVNGTDQCDDGNQVNTDGCTNACTTPRCGDGIVNGSDQCDDGNDVNNDACTNACTSPACGDGIKQAGEGCDDGNITNNDGCSSACTVESCGDGVKQSNEGCDDGNTTNNDGCSSTCTVESCGDGVKQSNEACDDGNLDSNDGCGPTCQIESCGDGIVQTGRGEECDGGEGCNQDCHFEEGEPRCGDGVVNPRTEDCDDGNIVDGDGCSANCSDEPPPPGGTPPPPGITGGAAPVIIPVTGEPHAITAGIAHTCAITPEGGVQCWGNNDFGQLGDGTNNSSNVPVDVIGFGLASSGSNTAQVLKAAAKPVFAGAASTIVAGGNHTCVISGSEVYCWGQNDQGQLGDGSNENRNKPVKVLSGAADITAGLSYTCAELFNGQVMCWGDNALGQLADGTTTDHNTPTVASLVTGLANIDAGQNKDCGITRSGLVRCVTSNSDDFVNEHPGPNLDVAVSRFNNLILALTNDGVPVEFKSGKPEVVESLTSVEDVDSGVGHVCALKSDGTVFCWGSNNYGQLGDESNTNSTDPNEVVDLSGAYQLAVGKNHVCVLIPNSTPGLEDRIMCWGLNTDGQLGDASNDNSNVPVEVVEQ